MDAQDKHAEMGSLCHGGSRFSFGLLAGLALLLLLILLALVLLLLLLVPFFTASTGEQCSVQEAAAVQQRPAWYSSRMRGTS